MGFYKELGDRLEKWLKEKIKVVDTKVESIAKYHKYVNTELDYCYLGISIQSDKTLAVGTVIPFNTFKEGNMEYNVNNYSIKLKAGKTYEISTDYIISSGFTTNKIFDKTNSKTLGSFVKVSSNLSLHTSPNNGSAIYSPTEDCEIQVKISFKDGSPIISTNNQHGYFIVREIAHDIVIDPLEYANTTQGIEDTPVGHIISHMGTVAPKHYLICDGAEYNISDYPYLAQHIEDNFGSINYFGGDGETTFAVPDLRGEFLRGTGTNSHANQGNGANVGTHQDATQHLYFCLSREADIHSFSFQPRTGYEDWDGAKLKADTMLGNGAANTWIHSDGGNTSNEYSHYTSRPTNTSVLYCIKYEPTYFMNTYNTNYMQPSMYSLEEKVVGSWIDGKPLYEKVVKVTMPNKTIGTSTPHGIENLDTLTNFSLNWYDSEDKSWYDRFRMWISSSTNYSISNELNIDSKNINITPNGNNIIDWSSRTTNAFCKLQYTKTTDEENSFTESMLKESFIKLDSTCTDEELQQAILDMVEEINAEEVTPEVIDEPETEVTEGGQE